jgi:hypothetical protein
MSDSRMKTPFVVRGPILSFYTHHAFDVSRNDADQSRRLDYTIPEGLPLSAVFSVTWLNTFQMTCKSFLVYMYVVLPFVMILWCWNE